MPLSREELIQQIRATGGHDLRLGGRPYCTIHLPRFELLEAVRNTQERLRRFGVGQEQLKGKTIIDLGCNVGGIAFECAKLGAAHVLGVDIVAERIAVAQAIKEFAGLTNVNFTVGDVTVDPFLVCCPADVVFCLALDGWVSNRKHLYQILGELTREVLYLETHDGMVGHTRQAKVNVDSTLALLKDGGFKDVQLLDMPQEDACESLQHYRPNLIARK